MKIEGMKELERSIKRLGNAPKTVATKSARSGGSILLRATKTNTPVDEGNLKRGLILKREKTRTKGKASYQVTFDAAMNDVFVKTSENGNRSYYPASQEYGYLTRDGGYIPGYRFMRKSAESKEAEVKNKMIDVASKEIDKLLKG